MSRKKTHKEYVQELALKNSNVNVVGKYIDSHTPILHRCIVHDVLWKTTPARALQGVGCPECKKYRFRESRCKTHQQYVAEASDINSDIVVIGEYVDSTTPIEHYCNKHNVLWTAAPDSILHGHGCIECGKEKTRQKTKKLHDEYIEQLNKINPNIEVIEEYVNANVAILHQCKIDGYQWYARPGNILFGKGCPHCKESNGERQVRQWLEKCNIEYVYQKTFSDCRDIKVLPFDFYIPEYNACIEYDGEQHFRPVRFNGKDNDLALKQFKKTRKHDEIKNQYCQNHNIHLLRIPYTANVEEELRVFFDSFNIVTSMAI